MPLDLRLSRLGHRCMLTALGIKRYSLDEGAINMAKREIDAKAMALDEDWAGNNAAFTCPKCSKVFIVSQLLHKNGRDCPKCGKAKGFSVGGQQSGGQAWIEWTE